MFFNFFWHLNKQDAAGSMFLWHLWHILDLARICFYHISVFRWKVSLIFSIIKLTVARGSNLHIGLSDIVNPLMFTNLCPLCPFLVEFSKFFGNVHIGSNSASNLMNSTKFQNGKTRLTSSQRAALWTGKWTASLHRACYLSYTTPKMNFISFIFVG